MLPFEYWTTIDNEPLYHVGPEPIMAKMEKFAGSLTTDYILWEYQLQTCELRGYCSWAWAIRRNSDETLKRNDYGWPDDSKMCPKCRGKGHPWTAEIWNGRPKEHMRSKGPLLCDKCSGNGYI
jgi:hypothetical protein